MVKTTLVTLLVFVGACLLLMVVFAALSRSGKPPGLVAGRLSMCPDKPNCVSSEHGSDAGHYLDPVTIQPVAGHDPLAVVRSVIVDMGGVIHEENSEYVAAVFSSSIFGFVDDLEIRHDTVANVIHLRSASRVGYSDTGVNRKRVALFRQRYAERTVAD